ncbi:hypothetical protein AB6F62_10070 [Providencia huaxiensis]
MIFLYNQIVNKEKIQNSFNLPLSVFGVGITKQGALIIRLSVDKYCSWKIPAGSTSLAAQPATE